jgi:hypothetical protein
MKVEELVVVVMTDLLGAAAASFDGQDDARPGYGTDCGGFGPGGDGGNARGLLFLLLSDDLPVWRQPVGGRSRRLARARAGSARRTDHRSQSAMITPGLKEGSMFQKISLMWAGLSKMDILLISLSCVTAGAVYAAFAM